MQARLVAPVQSTGNCRACYGESDERRSTRKLRFGLLGEYQIDTIVHLAAQTTRRRPATHHRMVPLVSRRLIAHGARPRGDRR
jgi:hypothetical protein